jgi:hypothetical protein
MKHYKTFGQTNGKEQFTPQTTPVEHLDFNTDPGPEPHFRAIRENQVRYTPINEPYEEPYEPQYQPQHQPQYQPQHQPQYTQITEIPEIQSLPSDYECKMIFAHINNCALCKRIHQSDNNTYITVIAILLIFCMFLLNKLLDRK